MIMKPFLMIVFIGLFFNVNAYADQKDILDRINYGSYCIGIFSEAVWGEDISYEAKTAVFYTQYHEKASAYILSSWHIKQLKKKRLIPKDTSVFNSNYFLKGKKVIIDYLNSNPQDYVPEFTVIKEGVASNELIPTKGTEPKEMTECKKKYLLEEEDLMKTGVFSLKLNKKHRKKILEFYITGFPKTE